MKHSFPTGHPKHGGRKKGTKNRSTVWVLESLRAHGVDYEKMLADALKQIAQPIPKGLDTNELHAFLAQRDSALEILDRLAKLAPHIANKPKEHVGLEGVDELVISPYQENKPEEK